MGFFDGLKRSANKSRMMKAMAAEVQSLNLDGAVKQIYAFHVNDVAFADVIRHFGATEKDIEAIVAGLMLNAGGTYRGHYVPVSAVMFPDTLAYLLKAERGQIGKAEAYFQVNEYFRTGAMVFTPK